MSADFWAGYLSGALGILIGNPLDLIKVRLQAQPPPSQTPTPSHPANPAALFPSPASLVHGAAAPVLGYGALNALLFVTYNRTESALASYSPSPTAPNLWTAWAAGAAGGLATWVVSAPTELVKCRAQLAPAPASVSAGGTSPSSSSSSWRVAQQLFRAEGLRGLYLGGGVTAVRDAVGYGFYFWSYELAMRWMAGRPGTAARGGGVGSGGGEPAAGGEAVRVLLCGGLAGIVTWASIFPLDVVKTRVQAQGVVGGLVAPASTEQTPLVGAAAKRLGAVEVARQAYREGGVGVFFRGLGVCSVRAFIVNAVQWAAYEWIMQQFGQGRESRRRSPSEHS